MTTIITTIAWLILLEISPLGPWLRAKGEQFRDKIFGKKPSLIAKVHELSNEANTTRLPGGVGMIVTKEATILFQEDQVVQLAADAAKCFHEVHSFMLNEIPS